MKTAAARVRRGGAGPHAPRVIRVFVSSTFRDMQAEREELVKRIFPQVRKLCEARGVTWGEVDLRWGVTEEQRAEGKVLPICLAEIRNCRPYFLGLLGERYGWVPEAITPELVEQQPWLGEHRERSVTELEILHGVLNDPAMADHAFFYFRDPSYLNRLPQGADPADFCPESDGAKAKLDDLKRRIRDSGFPLRDNYRDPKALGELVLSDLTALVDRLFSGERSQPGSLDAEAAEHEAFAESRTSLYIRRQEYFDRLDAHAAGDGPPLVVVGESSVGKSALLANWAKRYRRAHRDELVLTHFIGATPRSAELPALLRRILGELERSFGVRPEAQPGAGSLRDRLAEALETAAARGRIVLVLDALDRLDNRDDARELVWLPLGFPADVRVILSTLPGLPLDELQRRGWPTLAVEPLKPAARRTLISKYLAQYSKALSPEQVDGIARARQTAQPLYLRALLEELRVYGDHATLDGRISHYLGAPAAVELYAKILERYEQDYEAERPGLVRDAMSLLWAARRGLAEAELLDLLGSGGNPLPGAQWSPLYLTLDRALANHSGRLSFFHDAVRQAVERRYLPQAQEQRAAHLRIAAYFEARDLGPRKLEELPWQLSQAEAWERLAGVLGDIALFAAAWAADQLEVRAYWSQIEANSRFRFADAYRRVLEAPEQYQAYAWLVPALPIEVMRWGVPGAFEIGMQLDPVGTLGRRFGEDYLRHVRPKGDPGRLMEFLARSGDPGRAAEQLLGEFEAASVASRAAAGDPDKQTGTFQTMERMARAMGDREALAVALGGQALILEKRGDLPGALARFREEEQLYRELHHDTRLAESLGNQARILERLGEAEQALALLQEQERIETILGRADQLRACANSQARIRAALGDTQAALAAHQGLEQMARQTLDRPGQARSLFAQAEILAKRGDPEGALAQFREAAEIFRELGDPKALLFCLHNQAVLLARPLSRPAQAVPLSREAVELAREHDPEHLASFVRTLEFAEQSSGAVREPPPATAPVGTVRSGLASTPHPRADPEGEAQRNIQEVMARRARMTAYGEKLRDWAEQPWWKRWLTKRPERPET